MDPPPLWIAGTWSEISSTGAYWALSSVWLFLIFHFTVGLFLVESYYFLDIINHDFRFDSFVAGVISLFSCSVPELVDWALT